MDALPYEEPGILTILILSSFLLLLNIINYALDRLVYCGLIGQIFIGVAWGLPGAEWLTREVQIAVAQLGYLGLILIVFNGGLSTDLKSLRANLILSLAVALIGICTPIAASFALMAILPLSAVQAFAAGASLCSTSLGTIFTILTTSGLGDSRLGVVLTGAALFDDVAGLVLVQVISNISHGVTYATIVRPVLVSVAFATVVPLACACVARPLAKKTHVWLASNGNSALGTAVRSRAASFVFYTGVLLCMVTGSTYAGTSNLFAAYIAGASITWLDSYMQGFDSQIMPEGVSSAPQAISVNDQGAPHRRTPADPALEVNAAPGLYITGTAIYEEHYRPVVEAVLKPFFFASIGFSIPISRLFDKAIVWRGLTYAALMTVSKVICGLPLIGFGGIRLARPATRKLRPRSAKQPKETSSKSGSQAGSAQLQACQDVDMRNVTTPSHAATDQPTAANTSRKRSVPTKPRSIYPSAMLGSAMVSRGEIGFLISSVAEGKGIFGKDEFVVVTWAILLCTLVGPLTFGLVMRRVKRLQKVERQARSGKEDPLGSWGVVPVG